MAEKPSKKFQFHYIKSNSFRTVHADGVWGGATPRGYIAMGLYSERHPIPKTLTHKISDGVLKEELTDLRETKDGMIREVEVEVIMDLGMAQSLIAWLKRHVAHLEKRSVSTDQQH